MRIKRIALLVFITIVSVLAGASAHAQGPVLQSSSDLIFQTIPSDQSLATLFRMNSDLTIASFYTDSTIGDSPEDLRPLKWSPQGDLLAVYRVEKNPGGLPLEKLPDQLCLITRKGVLKVCFDDHPSIFAGGSPNTQDQLSTPDWSATGRNFYFVSRDRTNANIVQLVEADANTGHTLRTLYEDKSGNKPIFIWTRNLQYVADGVGRWNQPPFDPAVLINLRTKTQFDLNTVIPKNASNRIICPNFSRSGSYMTAVAELGTPQQPQAELLIFDKQGVIQHTIGPNTAYGQMTITCPTWRKDENTLYFAGRTSHDATAAIFQFTLQPEQLSVVYRLPTDIATATETTNAEIYPPVVLSTDEKQIAFESGDNPNGAILPAIKIVDLSGHEYRLLGAYDFTQYPVWIPPVPTSNSAKAAFASCKVNDKSWFNSMNAKIDVGQWNAVINEINAQAVKKIDQTCADDLIAAATYLSANPPGAKP